MAAKVALLLAGLASSALAGPRWSLNSRDAFTLAPAPFESLISSGCSTTGTQSCHNTTTVSNTCCFEANGMLALVQFWDTDPTTGPSNSWTIHGLWPDYCTSGYPESCDTSRAYTDISGLLTDQGASDTLSFMQTYWKNNADTDEELWEHEWAKHGTCMTTLQTKCLPSGSAKGAEAVAFYQTVVALFKNLPTYDWLSSAGITPSSSATHTYSALTSALQAEFGATPALDCESSEVYQVSYYYNLKGSVIDGKWIPVNAPAQGSCSTSGIKYVPKSGGSTTTKTSTTTTKSSTTTTTTTSPTGTTLPTKAHITALTSSGSSVGGLLTAGTWSTQTLATVTISGSSSGFTMSTSKGSCGVSSGTFSCGSGVSATTFTAVSSGGSLLVAYSGSTAFTSDGTPSGTTVYTVYTGSSHSVDFSLAIAST